jgi:DNA-binding NtrC family response regulator
MKTMRPPDPLRRSSSPGGITPLPGHLRNAHAAGSPTRQSGSEARRLLRKPVVLVVEDDTEFRDLLCALLWRDGCHALPCADGSELLRRIDAWREYGTPVGLDLVVCDVRLPGRTGLDLLGLVNDARLGIPVVLISGYDDMEIRVEAARRRVAAFIAKPFDPDRLRAAVRAFLRFG